MPACQLELPSACSCVPIARSYVLPNSRGTLRPVFRQHSPLTKYSSLGLRLRARHSALFTEGLLVHSSSRALPSTAGRTQTLQISASLWMAAFTAASGFAAWLFGVRHKAATLQIGSSAFQQAVLEHCPTINTAYTTYPILTNGHIETIFAAKARRTPYVQYDRTILDMPDGGKVTMDAEKANPSQVHVCSCPRLLISNPSRLEPEALCCM